MDRSFPTIEADLGKRLTKTELSSIFGLNYRTICDHYQELGGIRVGNRYIFFERAVINAVQKGISMGGPGPAGKAENPESIPVEEESLQVGIRPKRYSSRKLEDPFNIFSGSNGK